MSPDPADLLSVASVDAAVIALAERNRHHIESMDDGERAEAVAHWRELVIAVLTAATATGGPGDEQAGAEEGPGRAVIVFEDAGGDEVTIHASFHPQLEELGDGEVAATPAQIAALELLQELAGEGAPDAEQ